ncbi:putative tyrosine kinase receptor Cad96Ca [Apostichopus japonicus]|uniref:Putative tyrosine kinase receptor Cad96Ca n=1 Tax=Stichopus japonicus TaxID=307972 RepID=A0A2G8JXX8_STIJA|nr:putative tyrosine kinase receptor Cad96Ca [Apostichopus japonicus]
MAHAVIPAAVLNYRKAVNGSVLLNACHTWENNSIDWKFQNALLFFEDLLLRPEFKESLELNLNKSLYIQPISLLNIGKYECIKNHKTLLTYFLDVEVPPTLSMTVDGHSYHDNGDTLYIPYNTTIHVSCYATGSRPAVNLSITVDNVEISPSDSNTTTNAILNGTTFDTRIRFSLQTAEETGNMSCQSSSLSYYPEQRLDVTYSTYVPPKMSLKINEFSLNQFYFWVPQYKRTVITCFAWNARPKVNLSWGINDRDRIYTQTNVTEGDTKLYNSTSLLDYIPTQDIEMISCYDNSVTLSEYHVGVSLYTYVPPMMSLKINEFSLNQSYFWVPQYELMVITCFAWDARPKINLSWGINDLDTIYTITYVTEVFPQLYITLNGERTENKYVSAGENLTVICHADGARPSAVLSFNDRNEVVTEMTPTTNTSRRISFVLINPLKQENVTCTSTQRRDSECDLKTSVTVTVHLSDNNEDQRSDLPSIPIDESNSIHSSSSESNYYSAAEDRGTKDRIFTESEFCILLAIKVGTIYNRWMGTIRMSSDVNKCAVLTTITEGITKKKIIHWNSFVKRTLDLPTTDRLTRIEGIAVDKTNLYLVTEHSVCETLESRLTFDPGSHSSPFLVLDVMKHITAIVEGIECLQSFGFLHPGLSTKKILYTKEGICKLYDFCLGEDASKIVTIKKTQMNTVSFNQFPPESFFRNEYSAESDVWSTAVVIWEILSMGDSPFPVDEDIKPGQDVKAPTLTWPQRYFQLRYPLSTKLTKYHGNR